MLDRLCTAIAWVLKQWHALFSTFLDPTGGITWALSVVMLVALQKERGVNPLAGCLPILPQIPIFIGLFHVLRRIAPGKQGLHSWDDALTNQAAVAKLFGAPIASSFTMLEPKQSQILALTDGSCTGVRSTCSSRASSSRSSCCCTGPPTTCGPWASSSTSSGSCPHPSRCARHRAPGAAHSASRSPARPCAGTLLGGRASCSVCRSTTSAPGAHIDTCRVRSGASPRRG